MTTENPAVPSGKDLIDGSYAWLRLAVSMLLGTIGSIGFWGVVVILPEVQAEFGVDRSDASMPYTLTMVGFAAGVVLVVGDTLPAVGVGVATALLPPLVSSGMYYGYRTATTKADQRQELLSRSHRAMQTFLINCLSIVVGVSVGSFYMKYARSSC